MRMEVGDKQINRKEVVTVEVIVHTSNDDENCLSNATLAGKKLVQS